MWWIVDDIIEVFFMLVLEVEMVDLFFVVSEVDDIVWFYCVCGR